jgi:NPCBM/NEW2 domain
MDARRLFVVTNQGAEGPFDREQMIGLLQRGRLRAHDRLRTASGRNAGTVAEFIAEPEVEEVPNQEPVVPRVVSSTSEWAVDLPPTSRRWMILAAGGAVLVAIVLAIPWLLTITAAPVVVLRPVMSLTAEPASWTLGRDGAVIVHIDHPVHDPVIVPVEFAGTAVPKVDFAQLPERVMIMAGEISARIPVHPMPITIDRRPPVELTVSLPVGDEWKLGEPHMATVPFATIDLRQPQDPQVAWVDELPFVSTWNWQHGVVRRLSCDRAPISIAGVRYGRGLGMHAGVPNVDPDAFVTVNLAGRFQEFLAEVGIDDEVRGGDGVSFQVWVDGQPQFDSGVMRLSTPARPIRVALGGAKDLRLVVRAAGATNGWAHADWGGARLISVVP